MLCGPRATVSLPSPRSALPSLLHAGARPGEAQEALQVASVLVPGSVFSTLARVTLLSPKTTRPSVCSRPPTLKRRELKLKRVRPWPGITLGGGGGGVQWGLLPGSWPWPQCHTVPLAARQLRAALPLAPGSSVFQGLLHPGPHPVIPRSPLQNVTRSSSAPGVRLPAHW